ncbi:syntaxin 10 L-like [Pelomyxa schiedti]|nr:syntaxin 10 L-like [Pelomyxa schiedti]
MATDEDRQKTGLLSEIRPQDPFNVVRGEVQTAIQGMMTLYDQWKLLLEESPTSMDYQTTTKDLTDAARNIEWDLQDLEDSVGVVEANRHKFTIDATELAARKDFIVKSREALVKVQQDLNSPETALKLQTDSRAALMKKREAPAATNRFAKLEKQIEENNQEFINNQVQAQEQIKQEQDKNLDRLHSTVKTIDAMGRVMSDELATQDKLITQLGDEVDKTDGKIQSAVKRVNELIDKTNDSKLMIIIVVLVVVLVGIVVGIIFI